MISKRFFIYFLSLIISLSALSQNRDELMLSIVEKDSLYGIIDTSGNWYIPNIYGYIGPISEGYAYAAQEYNYYGGYIHLETKTFIPFENWNRGALIEGYNDMSVFDYSFLYAQVQGSDTVYISSQTRNDEMDIVSISCDSIVKNNLVFTNGIAPIGLLDEDLFFVDSTWGYVNENGNWIVKPSNAYSMEATEDFFVVGRNNMVTYVNSKGEFLKIKSYNAGRNFSEGLASVGKGKNIFDCYFGSPFFNKGKWGFIDAKGNEVIPLVYDYVESFSEGVAVACYRGKYGFINNKNQMVIPFEYESLKSFNNGVCAFKLNGLWGLMDINGKIIKEPIFDWVNISGDLSIIAVMVNGTCGYYDIDSDTLLTKPEFSMVFPFVEIHRPYYGSYLSLKMIPIEDDIIDIVFDD